MTMGRIRRSVSDRALRRTAWALAAVSTATTLVGVILALAQGLSNDVGLLVPMSIVGIGYAVIGARVVDVRPRNPVGWLLVGTALSWGVSITARQYAGLALPPGSGVPVGAALSAWISSWIWIPGAGMFLVFIPLLFPSGRSLSRRWQRFAVGMAILVALDPVLHAIGTLPHLDDVATLIAYDATKDPGVIGALIGLAQFWYFGSLVGVACVVIRLRRSVGIERQQIRWYAIAIAVAAVAVIVQGVLALAVGGPLLLVAVTVIPVSIGIAMLRYRLYELDRLVSRSIAYAVVTGLLVATYGGLTLLLERPLGDLTGGDTLPVALSTLAVAALFTPVRRRVQRIVDRRFDRARYDAEGTAAAFSDRLRNEVDLATVTADLGSTVQTAMAPTAMLVWLREAGG
jgi:hypothetical protein